MRGAPVTLWHAEQFVASALSAGGKLLFEARPPVHAALSWQGAETVAEVVTQVPTRICLAAAPSSASVSVDGKVMPAERRPDGTACVFLPRGGRYMLVIPAPSTH